MPVTSTKEPVWLRAALDSLVEHISTQEPLASVYERYVRRYQLGKKEREMAREMVFSFAREQQAYFSAVDAYMKRVRGRRPALREQILSGVVLMNPLLLEEKIFEHLPLVAELRGFEQSMPSFPKWLMNEVEKAYGEEAPALMAALSKRASPILAIDRRLVDSSEVIETLQALAVQAHRSLVYRDAIVIPQQEWAFHSLSPKVKSAVWWMDEGSQLAASWVNAQPGEWVLDMCAGGGGKTRFICQTGAQVVAMDKSAARLESALQRWLPEDKVKALVADGLHPPFQKGFFDWVLVDAPCSGTGVFRREPDRINRITEKEVEQLCVLQKGLLKSAAALVRPGGHLVYVTCSVLSRENEKNIEEWAKAHPSFKQLKQRQLLPHREGSDGFFMAHFQS